MNIEIICSLNSISVCAFIPLAKHWVVPADTSDFNFESK